MSGNFMTGECLSGMKIKGLFVSFTLMVPEWFEKVQTSFKELYVKCMFMDYIYIIA